VTNARGRLRYALGALARNLAAGLRLALLLPVKRLAFRVDLAQLVLLFALTCAIDVAGDRLRAGPLASFQWLAAGKELAGIALLGACALLVQAMLRRAGAALAIVVIVLAAWPWVEIAQYAENGVAARWPDAANIVGYAILAWIVAILVRAVALEADAPPRRRWALAGAGGIALALPLVLSPVFVDDVPWFRGEATDVAGAISPASEPVLAAQAQLLDDALADLDDRDPGAPNLYFVAYAPDGAQGAWTAHMTRVQKIVDDRLDTKGRSIVLRNDPETMLTTPFATVSNLRETLAEIAAAADPDEDVLMLYIGAAGGKGGRIDGTLPPLDLVALTPSGLRSLLDDAGFAWRIVVVAACYASAYADVLDDDHTAVVAASSGERASSGCDGRGDPTFFGDALFAEGFARSDSLTAAFDVARGLVAARERERGLAASNPVMRVGARIAPRIRHLRRFGGNGNVTARLARAPARVTARL
jgi:hypothetical protein